MIRDVNLPNQVAAIKRPKAHASFLVQFKFWSWIILGCAAFLQCIIFGSSTNIMGVIYVVAAWLIVSNTVLLPIVFKKFPLSSFLIIGFTATQFYLPLLFTLLEGKELVYNLKLPEAVFFHSFLALCILVAAHLFYCFVIRQGQLPTVKDSPILTRLGLFNSPNDLQVWLIGGTGLLAMFYLCFLYPAGGGLSVPVLKFIEALSAFTYAPYFIPFSQLYGRKRIYTKGLVVKLLLYTGVLFLISMGTNSRGAFMYGFTAVGYAFSLGLLLEVIKTRLFTIKNIVLGLFVGWLLVGPMADLGTAMVMVRALRDDTPKSQLVGLTWDAFLDKKAIADYRSGYEVTNAWGDAWDETYLDNIFLARFCNIKFNDISLELASQIGENDADVRQYSIDRIVVMLPQPIITALDLDVDKDAVNAIAYGDFMYYKATGNADVFGARLTGHFAGTGMAAFGWWYLAILAVTIIPVYILFDKLSVRNYLNRKNHKPSILFSFCGLISLTGVFHFLPMESVTGTVNFLLRLWIQLVLLYLVLYHVTRRLSVLLILLTTSPTSPLRRQVDRFSTSH